VKGTSGRTDPQPSRTERHGTKQRTPAAADQIWLQRMMLSLHLARDLHVAGAAQLVDRIHIYDTVSELPADVLDQTRTVLAATERLVHTDRPGWAAAIRDELSRLGPM
jgi:hypothetical protein